MRLFAISGPKTFKSESSGQAFAATELPLWYGMVRPDSLKADWEIAAWGSHFKAHSERHLRTDTLPTLHTLHSRGGGGERKWR